MIKRTIDKGIGNFRIKIHKARRGSKVNIWATGTIRVMKYFMEIPSFVARL
jgi:hypothetical protein